MAEGHVQSTNSRRTKKGDEASSTTSSNAAPRQTQHHMTAGPGHMTSAPLNNKQKQV